MKKSEFLLQNRAENKISQVNISLIEKVKTDLEVWVISAGVLVLHLPVVDLRHDQVFSDTRQLVDHQSVQGAVSVDTW